VSNDPESAFSWKWDELTTSEPQPKRRRLNPEPDPEPEEERRPNPDRPQDGVRVFGPKRAPRAPVKPMPNYGREVPKWNWKKWKTGDEVKTSAQALAIKIK